jgi:hypothetical protein
VIAYALVVLVFVGDWITPDSLVVGTAYEIPLVFAALAGSERLTISTLGLGVAGIGLGWFTDLWLASFQFSDVRIENRVLSLVSLLLVASLAVFLQRSARRTEALAGSRALLREAAVARALASITAADSHATAVRALAAEAPNLLGVAAAVWCSARAGDPSWIAADGVSEAKVLDVKSSSAFDALLRRAVAGQSIEVVSAPDSIDYQLGKTLGNEKAFAIPIGDGTECVAVVFAPMDAAPGDVQARAAAGNFVRFATLALQRADFVERAQRDASRS